jgi:hypothetical protein
VGAARRGAAWSDGGGGWGCQWPPTRRDRGGVVVSL